MRSGTYCPSVRSSRGPFTSWLRERGYSPRTVYMYSQYVNRAAGHLKENQRTLLNATEDEIHDWWATLPLSSSSRNGARHALIAFYKQAGRRDGRPAVYLPRLPAPLGIPNPIAVEHYEAFLAGAHALGGVHETFGGLLGYTGCRISEARNARWSQFELTVSEPVWRILGKGSGRRGPKPRDVPVHPDLLIVLVQWRSATDSPDWVFPSPRRDAPLSNSTMATLMHEIVEEAGLGHITAHRIRHTVASFAAERTLDIRAVQELLGHSSLATTQRYTNVIPRRVRAAVDTLGPREAEVA